VHDWFPFEIREQCPPPQMPVKADPDGLAESLLPRPSPEERPDRVAGTFERSQLRRGEDGRGQSCRDAQGPPEAVNDIETPRVK
jgi:hypothetical protein